MLPLVVFETHSWSEDNEQGIATGWLPGRLSEQGRAAALDLGERHRHPAPDVVYTSDLRRAMETAELAFGRSGVSIVADERLRECNFGAMNGAPVDLVHADRLRYLTSPYPQGESWEQAVHRVGDFIDDLWQRKGWQRAIVIGHVATRWGFEHAVRGIDVAALTGEEFEWQPGWSYTHSQRPTP